MRARWTACGACTSGSTAHRRGVTSRACGGSTTTVTTNAEASRGFPASLLRRLGDRLRCQRGVDDRLVRVHVGDGRDANAWGLDDLAHVDADAGADVLGCRGVVCWYVGR